MSQTCKTTFMESMDWIRAPPEESNRIELGYRINADVDLERITAQIKTPIEISLLRI